MQLDYTLVNSQFFDSPNKLAGGSNYLEKLSKHFSEDVEVLLEGFWAYVSIGPAADQFLPEQGFKVHLSATIENAEQILESAYPILYQYKIPFKFAPTAAKLAFLNSKTSSRSSSGKFITAYPRLDQLGALVDKLVSATSEFKGPYILSDRRHPKSRIVHYRYGGFAPIFRVAPDGRKIYQIRSFTGELEDDVRGPSFHLPHGVDDPFRKKDTSVSGQAVAKPTLLADRFKVNRALKFSNSGGVYEATDTITGRKVIIKEARPHTNVIKITGYGDDQYVDATDLLRNEYNIIQMLAGRPDVVDGIGLFSSWEHLFLVEEFVSGVTLSTFRGQQGVTLAPFDGTSSRRESFLEAFVNIAKALITCVRGVHDAGVIVGDLSPANIIVEERGRSIKLIDLESAYNADSPAYLAYISKHMKTIGIASAEKLGDAVGEDWFAVARCLRSFLFPNEAFLQLDPTSSERFLDRITELAKIPQSVADVFMQLEKGDYVSALDTLEYLRTDVAEKRFSHSKSYARTSNVEVTRQLTRSIQDLTKSYLSQLRSWIDGDIWPCDLTAFETNHCNLGVGTGGPMLFLSAVLKDANPYADLTTQYFSTTKEEHSLLPPGLFYGRSGIALLYANFGLGELAATTWLEAASDTDSMTNGGLMHGISGVGVAGCILSAKYGNDSLTDSVLKLASRFDDFQEWMDASAYGAAEGASGIALFLALASELARGERRSKLSSLAKKALYVDINHEKMWLDSYTLQSSSPYWQSGASGFVASAAKVYSITKDSEVLEYARRAMAANRGYLTVFPGQAEGLAGIGESCLDLFDCTGDESYRHDALEIARSILLYEARDEKRGLLYPGRGLLRFSHDYFYGSSGIGFFFRRLVEGGGRMFHDSCCL